ncbi:MAG TPA: alcohol dehydrogenase catalytic domain-containing protein, partial [archaeon]|nr:alcohol dehydrogenase catalytic domain-containing protein [archaeon]
MKAAVYYRNSDVRIEERPLPAIGPGEALVKVMAAGICGTDVLEWYRVKAAPVVLGHENAGVVEESKAADWKKGDRVIVSHHVPCNACKACTSGHHAAC